MALEISNVLQEDNDNKLELKTVQTSVFRTLIEALKEILTDINIEFDKTGMKIVALGADHCVLVHLKLEAEKFEYYHCPNRIVIGVGMLNFFKLIKTMGNNDSLGLYISNEDDTQLGIKIENGEKNSITIYKLKLMDLAEECISVPPATFESVITMPSSDFQKIVRDMYNLADSIEIKSVGQVLIFSCSGDWATQETRIGQTKEGMNFLKNNNPEEIVQGLFFLKYLVLFTKCTNLCQSIEMYLKNDYPIIIKYNVATLGNIKLCLAPQMMDS